MCDTLSMTCSRRLFLVASATTFAGAILAACGSTSAKINASDVPVGKAVIVEGFIIAQPSKGTYKAYSASCPHQGTKIDITNDDGTVECPNHHSKFSIEDGAVLTGPSRSGLMPAKLSAEGKELTAEL
ncbi:Rieske 2Fe-2S domain-containing protein [Corynebacterium canis]|uniref:Rieske 2Fe-2S domain-containing protein n=2 Tax=Corynebacterium canis TaxID=679663 RepID=A0A5C5UDK9_9CORY|nr:Rieske 2Fe-2S domain-containing protein [Corynebacterium canis]WJY76536.1 Rieske [2Fe-2S] domain protein [Corynebacterium canis]